MTFSRSLAAGLFSLVALVGCESLPQNAQSAPAQSAPAQSAPAQSAPAQSAPAQTAPVQTASAQPSAVNTASMITPLVEKRETLVATGYAVISVQNHKNPAQQRLLAIRASKLDAYRSLTEQVYGQQLDATTTVADMTVMSDTFRAKVEGVIYGAVLVSIAPVGEDTYETTLSLDQHVVRDLRSLYLNQLAARRR
jgi:hypothetical protein